MLLWTFFYVTFAYTFFSTLGYCLAYFFGSTAGLAYSYSGIIELTEILEFLLKLELAYLNIFYNLAAYFLLTAVSVKSRINRSLFLINVVRCDSINLTSVSLN